MNQLDRNKTGFSYTEKLNEYTRNPAWTDGYDIVRDGKLKTLPNGNVDFNANENYSTLWYTLSSAFEGVGNTTYTYIADLLQSARDIDVCTIHALKSIAEELDVTDVQIFDLPYPVEIEKLINLLSIPKNRLLASGVVISNEAINQVYEDSAITVSGVMGGYDLSAWTPEQQTYIQNISGDYQYISLSAWTDYIDTQISTCLLSFINLDGIVNDFKAQYDANPNADITATPDDDPEIEELKLTYEVSKSFHVRKAADNITLGLTKLSDYLPNQQIVIQQEIDNRDSQEKFGNQPNEFRRFRYESERRVREYIGLVEALNVYDSDYINNDDVFYTSGTPVNFFAEVSGTPVSGDLIQDATYTLRNICLKTSYQRDFLKNIARKHAIIGTSRVVQTIVSEYIARNFSSDRYWGYHTFSSGSPVTDISNLPVIDEELSSNILGDIRVVEYYDSTEYMNISANNEWDFTEPLVNERFWEGDAAQISKLLSEHTSAEVSSFYSNLGLNLSEGEIEEFLNHIYDVGAVTATLYPTFFTVPYTLPPTGEFGEYGRFEVDGLTLYLTADVLATYENQQSITYADWIGSPFISAKYATSAEFLTDWLETPSASAWQFGITIDTVEGTTDLIIDNSQFNFDNEDGASAWVVNTYSVSSWLENEVTNIWRESPLISLLPLEDFQRAWSEEPVISSWTSYDAVTAPTPPFDRLNWESIPEYIDYLALSGPITSQAQWLSTEFVRSWNENPFDIGDTSVNFDQETDWALSSNPYVSGWLSGDPFVNVFTNAASVTSVSAFPSQDLMAVYLNSIGAIDDPSGGFDNPTLSAMHFKYIGEPSGDFIPANDKNIVHPSIALQPYIWNLVEAVFENIFFEDIYSPIVLEFDDLSGRIDQNGAPINMWRKTALDFTGYRTYYEFSRNLDTSFNEDERIDPDGPWHAPALKAYLDPISGTTDAMLSAWYGHLNLTDAQTQKVSAQMEGLRSDIYSLSSKIIYNYAVDQYGNHYTLFKDDDEFETPGELWLRYNDHPLSFPIFSDTADQITIDDLEAQRTKLDPLMQRCLDFGIDYVGPATTIWMYGSTNLSIGPNTYALYAPIIEIADDSQYEIKWERWPSLFSHKDIKHEPINGFGYKFIGAYTNENDLIIVKGKKIGNSAAAPVLDLVSGTSYDTYTATIQWDVINYSTGESTIQTKVRGLKYSEYDLSNQSQWRLSKGEDTITLAFESQGPSAASDSLFYIEGIGQTNSYFDPNLNECSGKLFDNGITVMDFDIGTNTSIGDNARDPDVSYYYAYTDLTYQGINAGNGLSGYQGADPTPTNYDILSGDCVKLQYFGNPETSTFFLVNESNGITCFNTLGEQFGITLGFGLVTWETALSSWDEYGAISATWELSSDFTHIFTSAGEIFPSGGDYTTTSGYYVKYNGEGCHLFEVCYDPS